MGTDARNVPIPTIDKGDLTMPDNSPEDEIISEARQFVSAMSATLRRYAQAASWLERRKIRKEITQAWRVELKTQDAARAHHLLWANQAVDRYRAHSLAVAERADNPTVDHDRRYRDAQALARHRTDMQAHILRDPHLTPIEQGIAIDGLDAATTFPAFEPGRLFNRSHKVKGIEALRYRAQVARAREAAGIERPAATAERAQRSTVERSATDLNQLGQQHEDSETGTTKTGRTTTEDRFIGLLEWDYPDGWVRPALYSAPTEQALMARIGRELHNADSTAATNLRLLIADRTASGTRVLHRDDGHPAKVIGAINERGQSVRPQTPTRLPHGRSETAGIGEDQKRAQTAETNEPYRWETTIRYRTPGSPQVSSARGLHSTAAEAEQWVKHTLRTLDVSPDTTVTAASWENNQVEPAYIATGRTQFVMDEVTQWRTGVERAEATPERGTESHPDRPRTEPAAPERDTAPSRAEYDALARKVDDLSRRYQQVDMARRTAVDDLSALRADHVKLTTQVNQLTTERDEAVALAGQRTQERDEAVAKVIAMTPPDQRINAHNVRPTGPQRPKVSMSRPEMANTPGNGAHRTDIGDGFDR
ncbi:hypothetical protein [Nocardia sp. CS682]|uniref:hypothetical protein n=1 Tax=Nocardia sp. CS682 TaxID=1047172 RepID=UPI00107577C8|nr:hypothetical protein [Nocardia sp. CS682]QBS43573.1 hypothetical protein DMB37_29180 [Nocardia sp. CS682]